MFDAYLSSTDLTHRDVDTLATFGVTSALLVDDLDGAPDLAALSNEIELFPAFTLNVLGEDLRRWRSGLEQFADAPTAALHLRLASTGEGDLAADLEAVLRDAAEVCNEASCPLLLNDADERPELLLHAARVARNTGVAIWVVSPRVAQLQQSLLQELSSLLIIAPHTFANPERAKLLDSLAHEFPGRIALGSGTTAFGRNPWALPSAEVALAHMHSEPAAGEKQEVDAVRLLFEGNNLHRRLIRKRR